MRREWLSHCYKVPQPHKCAPRSSQVSATPHCSQEPIHQLSACRCIQQRRWRQTTQRSLRMSNPIGKPAGRIEIIDIGTDQAIELVKHAFEIANRVTGRTIDPSTPCAVTLICRRSYAKDRGVALDRKPHGTAQRLCLRYGDAAAFTLNLGQEISRMSERTVSGRTTLACPFRQLTHPRPMLFQAPRLRPNLTWLPDFYRPPVLKQGHWSLVRALVNRDH